MSRCIVYTRIRLLLHIHPFISSCFFLSNYQTLKFFVTLFPETVRPRRLKLGTHMSNGQVYHVYQNQAAPAYSSLYFFIFLSRQFSNVKIFRHTFSQELWGLEGWNLVHTWTVDRRIVYTGIRLLLLIHPFIFHFSFSQIFKHEIFVTLFSGTVRPRRLKLVTNVENRWMYLVNWNHAAALIGPFIFIFLSLQFSNIKYFHHTFLRNCEA